MGPSIVQTGKQQPLSGVWGLTWTPPVPPLPSEQ
jgi:hypothetical protein